MRWRKGRLSQNIEDRRDLILGMSKPAAAIGGGVSAATVAITAAIYTSKPDIPAQSESKPALTQSSQESAELADFVSAILADTEDTWTPIFANADREYIPPKLVLFSGSTESACGFTESAIGPFYCTKDQKVYIDLSFYQQLRTRFNAPGDFAQAYVVAHEVGHHVQNLLGITQQVSRAMIVASDQQKKDLQKRMELQADCLAGVWASHAHRHRNLLEEGDIEEGLNAAAAIGDDSMQQRTKGYVVPESFTHGSAAQRQNWFLNGLKSGNIATCDTFSDEI